MKTSPENCAKLTTGHGGGEREIVDIGSFNDYNESKGVENTTISVTETDNVTVKSVRTE